MTSENRSDETKCEPDPRDGIETKEALTDEQLASIAAGGELASASAASASVEAMERRLELTKDRRVLEAGRP